MTTPPLLFVAARNLVMRGSERIAEACSHNMAIRIANALNAWKTDSRGQ